MDNRVTEVLLSTFGNLCRLEGDTNKLALDIIENRKDFAGLSKNEADRIRKQIKDFFLTPTNVKKNTRLAIFLLSIYASFLYDGEIDDHIEEIYNEFQSFKEKNAFINNLVSIAFRYNTSLDKPLAKIYHSFVTEFKNEHSELKLNYNVNENRTTILLVTSQILSVNHSPTQLLLEVYDALLELGLDPLIAQIQSLSTSHELPFIDPFKGHYIDTPEGLQLFDFDGKEVPIYNLIASNFDDKSFRNFFQLLNKIKPGFMINIGGYNVFQEFIASKIPSLILTTTSMLTPSPYSEIVSVFNKLSSSQINALENANIDSKKYKKLVSQAAQVPSLYNDAFVDKSEFGYSADDILLAIVSNRLSWELQNAEIEFIRKTLSLDSKIKFLIVGLCDEQLSINIKEICGSRVEFIENIEEIDQFLTMIDFLINTRRLGGGLAAAKAIGHGTPTFSINYGDVTSLLPDEYLADNYDELFDLIADHLHFDRLSLQNIAHNIFRKFPKFKDNIRMLIKALEFTQNQAAIKALAPISPEKTNHSGMTEL